MRGLLRPSSGWHFDRLADVKTRWDPANLFRPNHNVRPRQKQRAA